MSGKLSLCFLGPATLPKALAAAFSGVWAEKIGRKKERPLSIRHNILLTLGMGQKGRPEKFRPIRPNLGRRVPL